MQTVKDMYSLLTAIQLFPEVMAAALAAYFIVRQRYDMEKWAVWVPVVISYTGQMAFAWPKTMQDVFMCFTMGMIQAGLALGAYSFLDKYGITDRFGRFVQKKIDDKTDAKGAENAPTTPQV